MHKHLLTYNALYFSIEFLHYVCTSFIRGGCRTLYVIHWSSDLVIWLVHFIYSAVGFALCYNYVILNYCIRFAVLPCARLCLNSCLRFSRKLRSITFTAFFPYSFMSSSESESEVYVYSSDGSDFDGFTEVDTRRVATDRAACHSASGLVDFDVGDLESSESSDSDSSTDEVSQIKLYSNMCMPIIVIYINL